MDSHTTTTVTNVTTISEPGRTTTTTETKTVSQTPYTVQPLPHPSRRYVRTTPTASVTEIPEEEPFSTPSPSSEPASEPLAEALQQSVVPTDVSNISAAEEPGQLSEVTVEDVEETQVDSQPGADAAEGHVNGELMQGEEVPTEEPGSLELGDADSRGDVSETPVSEPADTGVVEEETEQGGNGDDANVDADTDAIDEEGDDDNATAESTDQSQQGVTVTAVDGGQNDLGDVVRVVLEIPTKALQKL